jgi:hypothetical protein
MNSSLNGWEYIIAENFIRKSLLANNKIDPEEAETLRAMLDSDDKEARILAMTILETQYNFKIIIDGDTLSSPGA